MINVLESLGLRNNIVITMQEKRSVPLAQFEPDFVPKNRPPFMCVSTQFFFAWVISVSHWGTYNT